MLLIVQSCGTARPGRSNDSFAVAVAGLRTVARPLGSVASADTNIDREPETAGAAVPTCCGVVGGAQLEREADVGDPVERRGVGALRKPERPRRGEPRALEGQQLLAGLSGVRAGHPVLADRIGVGEPDQRHRRGVRCRAQQGEAAVGEDAPGGHGRPGGVHGDVDAPDPVRERAGVAGEQVVVGEAERAATGPLELTERQRQVARKGVGAGDGHGDPRGAEPDRLELGEVEAEAVRAADVAHPQVEVVQPDHPDRRRELVGESALREPRCLRRPGRGSGAATGERRRRGRPRSRG